MNSTSPAATLSPAFTSTFQTLPGTIVSIFSAMLSPPLGNALRTAGRVQLLAQRLRLVDADGPESIDVAWLRLPELPERRRRHGIGAHEPTHAGSVIHQDHRRLAAQMDRPTRIALIDDVGRLGAVLRGLVVRFLVECPLRPLEPESGAVALRRQLPVSRQEALVTRLVDPVVVGPRHHLDRPDLVRSKLWTGLDSRLATWPALGLRDRHHLALLQRASLHAAHPGLVEGRTRPQPGRRVDAAGKGDVAAHADLR